MLKLTSVKEKYESRDVTVVVDSEKACNPNGKDESSKRVRMSID